VTIEAEKRDIERSIAAETQDGRDGQERIYTGKSLRQREQARREASNSL
jgi:hypothetical protein